jgi:hypothetical protein
MKKLSHVMIATCLAFTLTLIGCSKDEDVSKPEKGINNENIIKKGDVKSAEDPPSIRIEA